MDTLDLPPCVSVQGTTVFSDSVASHTTSCPCTWLDLTVTMDFDLVTFN